ncbi:MAG: nickel-responsive transcriptional regulator NikR, partial [Candidatus Omnitrophica bacterium]|nr:nickel-responsive transcriptional regulator NikR [Candidatus Omnitrophota bacterium]
STQHIHLDHKNCLEIIAAKGQAQAIVGLAHKLRAVKGIKHASFTTTTSGKKLI